MKKLFFLTLFGLVTVGANAQRVTDKLDRGIVAVPSGSGNLVSWRKFGSEYYDTQYNLYRDGSKIAGPISVSNFNDAGGNTTSKYAVEAIVRGVTQTRSSEVQAWSKSYFDIPVLPVVNRAGKTIGNSETSGSSTTSGYTLNDVTLADVDGDGVTEFIVKRNNSQGNLRSASNMTDFNLYECYKLDGTRLWWIDLGPNLMAGADEQWDLIAYDWDQDGKAEGIMRGADNMIIHTATGKTINIGDMTFGFSSSDRPEYMGIGKEYLLYLNGETGEPYGWDGSENWVPMDYPLPQFESDETYGSSSIWGDLGHRMQKHYFGAPYLDGRNPSIFLGRGAYTRHKMCAFDVNPTTHELTQRWRWNCYDGNSPWFANGFHNFAIADVDMDGRDEIMFGSMCIDDTGYGLSTTGLGHGDAQHCGDFDPYRWGLEQFTCQEGSQGNSYWNPTTGQIYYRKSDGGDDGRALAGNFTNAYPGGQGRSVSSGVIGLSSDRVINTNGDAMSGGYANLNNRIYWDGDLLDEILNSTGGEGRPAAILKWGGSRIWQSEGAVHNNSSKCNPSAQGDILGDWREEVVLRTSDNSALRIFCTTYTTDYDIYTLWDDHVYRNGIAWQCVGYNQPPHVSFYLGELENITVAPPPVILQGRTEVPSGATIQTTGDHLLISGYENKTINVADGANPYILTVNAPAWVKGSGSQQAVASTPKSPERTVETYTTTLIGGAFSGATRLIKQGEGVLVLPNVIEKHTGETNVWNGTLQFDGTFDSSPLWLNRHTTLVSNGGQFNGGIKADYNATIYPGGKGNVGNISTTRLELGFGSRIVFETNGSSIDKVNADELIIETKDWEFGPKYKTPVFEFVGVDQLADAKYEVGTIGSVTGQMSDILVEGISDKRFELMQEDGKLYLLVETMREPTTVIWNGTDDNNIWDLAVTENFLSGSKNVYAVAGDDIVFNDDAVSTTVNVRGAVSPASITFNNDTKAYVLQGDSILGQPTLTKNGTGKLTITNENRLGNTTINAGTLSVNALANNTGVTYGALGSVSQTITLNEGATLNVSQPVMTDQQINVSGDVTLDVSTNMSLTLNKGLKGTGAVVSKTGPGTLTTGSANTYSKLIIKAGTVNAIASNNVDQLPATVEFQGGVLWGATMEDTPGITNNVNFVVSSGKTGEFRGAYRGNNNGKLTGSGTFIPVSGGVRCYWNGDWSQFEGTIRPLASDATNRQNKKAYTPTFNITNSKGFPKATLNLVDGQSVSNQDPQNGKAYNVEVGNVTGTGTLAGTGTWTVGGLGTNMLASFKSTAPIIKRGAGYLQVSGIGNLSGSVTVEEGELRFNDTKLDAVYFGALTIKNKGSFMGRGLLSSLTMESGTEGTLSSMYSATTPGIIKMSASANIKSGATLNFVLKSSAAGAAASPGYSQLNARFLTVNGTVKVVLADGYTPKVGDSFTLWTVTSTFSGTPVYDLPDLPDGLYWDVSALANATGVLSITDNPTDGVGRIAANEQVTCKVYTTGGVLVGTFETVRSEIQAEVARLGVKRGLYVVRMTAGRNIESQAVVVR